MILRYSVFVILTILLSLKSFSQSDSIKGQINFSSDFRFRVEQDWNSIKPDGTYRKDRTRLRYRVRVGVNYSKKWYSVGLRLRTGNPKKQQDPQLTLGDNLAEFGTLPIGLEKAYFEGKWDSFRFWLGKNNFPFEKNNELFWSDNVYPEGAALKKGFKIKTKWIDTLDIRAGHFIIRANSGALNQDSYFQGGQFFTSFLNKRIQLFPSFYFFNNIQTIPDNFNSFKIDYAILQIGSKISLLPKKHFNLELDFLKNFSNYPNLTEIDTSLIKQTTGVVVGFSYGKLKNKGDWKIKASYTHLERFAAVDFLAQNDWARWDYSNLNSPDGRLTNMQGVEFVTSYMINNNVKLTMKYYTVKQLIKYGSFRENGSRIRFDLDVKF